jgi:hypothetical protein
LENKEWPGWCFYHPWDLQDGAGTGSTEYRRKWVYRSLPEMATLPWKVHCPPGWICREILKYKAPPISYSFCFIGPFAFVIEHTSYVLGVDSTVDIRRGYCQLQTPCFSLDSVSVVCLARCQILNGW